MIDQTAPASDRPAAARAKLSIMLPHVVRRNFLPEDVVAALIDYTVLHEADFVPTEIRARFDPTIRVSSRLVKLGAFREIIGDKIRDIVPALIAELRVAPFQLDTLEFELVAHGDGAFYKRHIDVKTAPVRRARRSRALSAVYYFHAEPKAFSGGALRLYGIGDGAGYVDIEPVRNSLLVFPSWAPHEVTPVQCPSRRFADSRFAINCWIHRTLSESTP
jgi:Rps23 Pro-64 3,4-dihydroxylase Tpa1-like proline 4-hydroxylase